MKYLDYRETVQHGTFDFPIALYKIDPLHPQYDMMYHWHPECEIIRINSGKFLITLDSEEIIAEKGDIVYVTDGVMHAGHAVEECEYDCVVFDAKGVTSGSHAGIRQMENVLSHKRVINSHFKKIDAELANIINCLFDAMDKRYAGYEFTVTGTLMQFYGYVFKNHLYSLNAETALKPKEQQLMMRDVVSFIEMNYAEKISLN
ncbi:MAG: cupin domain-containing protein, partial [Clostridia bacterium]|nr:cupin domain-containing protein [Clostridia bacterium]